MARRLHQQRFVADCELTLIEVGNPKAGPGYLPDPLPDPRPLVQVGAGGLVIETRCPDDASPSWRCGWATRGSPPRGWEVVFDGQLETAGRGFDAGDATASVF